ncbi:MAG: DUF4097 domain-containing protein [Bacteroidetes bacterium]|nr:DUF4097 domain-containing protein [Bacteroidota bacterium]MBU1116664.1 DUF4097 domain-containing protein [Bacteroidota bacterium]MBU1797485.1 DUF4097 domain-containing protein [Bacteroidota bacterium]
MDKIRISIIFVLLCVVSIYAEKSKKIKKSFPVAPEIGIEIISVSGMDLSIKTWDKQEVYFNLKVSISSNDDDYELDYINSFDILSELSGSNLTIKLKETDKNSEWNFWDIFKFKIASYISKDITGEIFIPKQNDFSSDFKYCDIKLSEAMGEINLDGRSNDLSLIKCKNVRLIKNPYGDVKIENCGGTLELSSRSSENIVDNFDGDVMIKSEYSNLTIHSIKGDLNIDSRSAEIDIKNISKSLTIDADYSNIDMFNVAKSVKLKSRSGKINIDKVGTINLESPYSNFIIKNVSGKVETPNRISSRSGTISISKMAGGCIINSEYSNMELDSIKGNVSIESRSNSIIGKNIEGDLNLETMYSDISFLNIYSEHINILNRSDDVVLDLINTPKKLSVTNKYGDIDISLPKKYNGGISIESTYGNIESDFEFEKEIDKSSTKKRFRKGENSSSLTLEIRSGNIRLKGK